MIVVENLSKYYGATKALKNIYLEVAKGEVFGLLGLNGAGKSTCLRVLSGFLIPTTGQCFIDKKEIYQDAIKAREKIGYLPENPPLYPELRVIDYLIFVSRMKGITRKSLMRGVNHAINITNIGEVKNAYIRDLSLGFRKRVGIAQTLLGKPKVIILDEPVSGLDPLQIVEMRKLIRKLAGRFTIILSSHILTEVSKTCDRVQLIHEGEMVGELSGISLKRNLERAFMQATKKLTQKSAKRRVR